MVGRRRPRVGQAFLCLWAAPLSSLAFLTPPHTLSSALLPCPHPVVHQDPEVKGRSLSHLQRRVLGVPSPCFSGYRAGQWVREEAEQDLTGDGGVVKRVIRPGWGYKGQPSKGSYIKLLFTMKTADGVLIHTQMDEPLEVTLDAPQPDTIRGWDIALATMTPNEIAEVTCSPEYAWGMEGKPPKIPPAATIVSRIQMVSWRRLEDSSTTDLTDTHEMVERWREELGEGTSPLTGLAEQPNAQAPQAPGSAPPPNRPSPSPATATATATATTPPTATSEPASPPPSGSPPQPKPKHIDPASAMGQKDGPKVIVDIDDPAIEEKQFKDQVVYGKSERYRWKEKPDHMELVIPVPEGTEKADVVFELGVQSLRVGYKKLPHVLKGEREVEWLVDGKLLGSVEITECFWVFSREDYRDDLTEGKTCVEVRLEKKSPMRRIWATVFEGQ